MVTHSALHQSTFYCYSPLRTFRGQMFHIYPLKSELPTSLNMGTSSACMRLRVGCTTSDPLLILSLSTDDPSSNWISARSLNRDLGSEACFELLRGQLRQCMECHEPCRRSANTRENFIPSRVVDVSSLELGSIQLTNGADIPASSPYVALSYCWGDSQPESTTTSNIHGRFHGFSVDSQPQSIKDAILVTRRLGIKYIWVDRLCIIQDDQNDRARELGMMHQVYRCTTLVISAAMASSSTEGFLRVCDPTDAAFRLRYRCPNGELGSLILSRYKPGPPDPIHRRAWTLQEHMLAPRLAIYGTTGLRFSCSSGSYKDGPPTDGVLLTNVAESRNKFSLHSSDILRQKLLHFEGDLDWYSLLTEYHSRRLSFPVDRMAAIGSIVDRLSDGRSGRYLAGLWESDLAFGLLWEASRDNRMNTPRAEGPTRDQTPDFPSWSWASISDNTCLGITPSLLPERARYTSKIQLLDAELDLLHPEAPLAHVSKARLRLRGRLIPVTCKAVDCYSTGDRDFPWPAYLVGQNKYRSALFRLTVTKPTLEGQSRCYEIEAGALLDVETDMDSLKHCYYLEILQARTHRINTYSQGLVVIPKDESGTTFTRVGKCALQHVAGPEFRKFGGMLNLDATISNQGWNLEQWRDCGDCIEFDLV